VWDGRDDAGRNAPSGTYMVIASCPKGVGKGSVVLIR
jgi:flagellar hook assembly protein FlgD